MQLRREKMLPAIVFCFDRKLCDKLSTALVESLAATGEQLFKPNRSASILQKLNLAKESLKNVQYVTTAQLSVLDYGVAVHHAGAQNHYLREVEHLFLAQNLPLMIATGTLALGTTCRQRYFHNIKRTSHVMQIGGHVWQKQPHEYCHVSSMLWKSWKTKI